MEKFNLLVFMTRKLFALANNKCAVEGADAVMMQECLLGGHLYLQVLKEKFYLWLTTLRMVIMKRAKSSGDRYKLTVRKYFRALPHSTGKVAMQIREPVNNCDIFFSFVPSQRRCSLR